MLRGPLDTALIMGGEEEFSNNRGGWGLAFLMLAWRGPAGFELHLQASGSVGPWAIESPASFLMLWLVLSWKVSTPPLCGSPQTSRPCRGARHGLPLLRSLGELALAHLSSLERSPLLLHSDHFFLQRSEPSLSHFLLPPGSMSSPAP